MPSTSTTTAPATPDVCTPSAGPSPSCSTPDHGFGEPTLVTGARTEAIAELVGAGEPRDLVAAVYDITVNDVDAAVRYENHRAA